MQIYRANRAKYLDRSVFKTPVANASMFHFETYWRYIAS